MWVPAQAPDEGRRSGAEDSQAVAGPVRDGDHRAVSPPGVVDRRGLDGDVPGRGLGPAGGRYHGSSVGHAGQCRHGRRVRWTHCALQAHSVLRFSSHMPVLRARTRVCPAKKIETVAIAQN